MADAKDLIGLTETKTALRVSSAAADAEIETIITQATEMLEEIAGRQFVLRDGNDVTEYHDLGNPQGFLQLRLFPVISVTGVYIGPNAVDPLDASNYVIDSDGGVILLRGAAVTPTRSGPVLRSGPGAGFFDFPEDAWRLSGRYFGAGVDAARVVYKGGYADTASADGGLKQIAFDLVARIYRERERKSQGLTSEVAQGMTIGTKWQPDLMTKELRARLRPYMSRSQTAR